MIPYYTRYEIPAPTSYLLLLWLAGWLAGHKPLPLAALTLRRPPPLPRQVRPPCSAPQRSPSHSRRRLPKWQSNVRSRLHLLIFRLSISQSPSISPGRCTCLSSTSSLFVNGNSPDLVPLFVLVCAAFVTPVCVRRPLSNPSLRFRPCDLSVQVLSAAAILSSLFPAPTTSTTTATKTQDHTRQTFLVSLAYRTVSTVDLVLVQSHSLRSLS